MARKSNTVRKDGRIAVQVYIGRSENGNRRYKTVYGSTQKEANQKADEIRLKLRKGIEVTTGIETFEIWATHWLKFKEVDISHGMIVAYRSAVKHLSVLNHLPIDKIKTVDIQSIVLNLAAKNPTTGKPSSKKTLNMIRITSKQIFDFAIENRIVEYNPASNVKIPKNAPQETRRALTKEEQTWIINTPHRAQRAGMIMMYAGLRRGELIPLTWNDINLEKRTINVNKTVEFINGKPHIKTNGKTKNSIREIAIPNILVEFLKLQDKGDNILVCPSAKGTLMSESAWKRLWESYLLELNLKYGNMVNSSNKKPISKFAPVKKEFHIPRITAHWLRHTFVTLMYLSGVDVLTAMQQAGHADIQTTLGIYTHLNDEHKTKNISKMDDYIKASASQMQVSEVEKAR